MQVSLSFANQRVRNLLTTAGLKPTTVTLEGKGEAILLRTEPVEIQNREEGLRWLIANSTISALLNTTFKIPLSSGAKFAEEAFDEFCQTVIELPQPIEIISLN